MRSKAVALSLSCFFLGCSSSSSSDNPADAGNARPSDGGATSVDAGPPSDTVAESTRAKCGYDVGSLAAETQGASAPDGATIPIDTIVIVMMENRSFDHYFQDLRTSRMDAGDGSTTASSSSVDVAPAGVTNPGDRRHAVAAGARRRARRRFVPSGFCFADTNHGWDGTHQEINGGKMDGFAVANDGTHEDPMLGPPDFLERRAGDDLLHEGPTFPSCTGRRRTSRSAIATSRLVPGPTWPNREYLYAGTSWGETTTGAFPKATTPTVLDTLYGQGRRVGQLRRVCCRRVLLFSTSKTYQSLYSQEPLSFDAAHDRRGERQAAAGHVPRPEPLPEGYDNDDEHPPAVMQVGEHWLAGVVKDARREPAVAAHGALHPLRRARRALRSRGPAAGVPARRDAADTRAMPAAAPTADSTSTASACRSSSSRPTRSITT